MKQRPFAATECNGTLAPVSTQFSFDSRRPIEVTFDGAIQSSDGGWLLLRQADQKLRLCERFATRLPDTRNPLLVVHTRLEQTRQRVFQIAAGYEDTNDATRLRVDPLLKTVCGAEPGQELSSQPTLHRYENSVDARANKALMLDLETQYVESLSPDETLVILDFDSTSDPTHGNQQLSMFHGFYDCHMYHPLLVFDGQTGQIVTALLRPGTMPAAKGSVGLMRRLARQIRARCPHAEIIFRADGGFGVPRVFDCLEQLNRELGSVAYIIGMAQNARLLAKAAPLMKVAESRYHDTLIKARCFGTLSYAAESWEHERTVIVKAEHAFLGANPRFVVTSLRDIDEEVLYDRVYCARGQCENNIKDFKNALAGDRLSCSTFIANQFRLLLHVAAYRLCFEIRTVAKTVAPEVASWQFDTMQLRLFKVAALVKQTVRHIVIKLPLAFPQAAAFVAIAAALGS